MILNGPYNSPMTLGVRPWGSLFWALWASMLIPLAVFSVIKLIAPSLFAAYSSFNAEFADAFWLVICVGYGTALVLTMAWAEYIGAGPFAGDMRARGEDIVLAVFGGPLVLLGSFAVVSMIFSGGDPTWAVREDIDLGLYSIENAGLLLVVFVLLIAPVLEEVAFRGIGMGCLLARGWDASLVVGLSAMIFTLGHTQYQPAALIPVFTAGMFLGWLRVRSGTVAAPLIAHISANAVQVFLQ